MRIYKGTTDRNGWPDRVFREDNDGIVELDPRYDLVNHSPDGFSWGYNGSGPAQLAIALLADIAGDAFALANYQLFKDQVVARFPQQLPWQQDIESSCLIQKFLEKRAAHDAVTSPLGNVAQRDL